MSVDIRFEELNNIFWGNLDGNIMQDFEACFNTNVIFPCSLELRDLVREILIKQEYRSVLVPAYNLGNSLSWVEDDKKIVGFEQNVDIFNLTKRIWNNKGVDLLQDDFINALICGKFDAIVYTSPCGWVKRDGHNIGLEERYLTKSLDILQKDGIIIVTVPNNVLTAPLWQDIRSRILEEFSLEMVIYCGRLFQNVGIEWYTLIIKNKQQRELTYFPNYNKNPIELMNNYLEGKGEFWVNKNELRSRWDRTYLDPKYESLRNEITNKNTIKLGEIASIIPGMGVTSEERKEKGDYLLLSPRLINKDNELDLEERRHFYCDEEVAKTDRAKRAILQENDIVISLMGDFRWYKFRMKDLKIIPNQHMAIVRTKAEHSRDLELFFESVTGQEYLKKQTDLFARGDAQRRLSVSDLRNFVIPTIEVLESGSKYQSIKNPIIKIADAFEKEGWEVEQEYAVGNAIFDIALLHQGELKGIIEVKNVMSKDLSKKNTMLSQLRRYQKSFDIASVFLFVDNELYLFRNEKLIRLPEIPAPNFSSLEYLKDIYIEERADAGNIPLLSLPDNAVSLSDSYRLETMIRELSVQIDRVEGKLDDVHEIVKEIAQQISNYQSLVGRLLYRAVDKDEMERIMQSFADECSDRIVNEVNRNISEREYAIEEKKLRTSLGDAVWNKLEESSKTFLASSKLMYNNLLSLGNLVDYSGVCLLVTKALEVEMSKRFYSQYVTYLGSKYPGKANLDQWPTTLLNKYGKRKRAKDFTLGSVAYILCYLTPDDVTVEQIENNKAKLLEFSRNELFIEDYDNDTIESCLLDYAERIEEVRNDYRNPAAHTNELKKVDADNCFALVTDVEKILKIMLESFVV